MRKHELAETSTGEIVYRLKNGNIVNWVTAVTSRAEEILGIIEEDKDDIHSIVDGLPEEFELARAQIADMASSIYGMRDEVEADVQTVSGIKDDVLGLKSDVLDAKEIVLASVQSAEDSANLAEKWANYMEGTVDSNEYSAKYYATSISNVSDHVDQTAEDIERTKRYIANICR